MYKFIILSFTIILLLYVNTKEKVYDEDVILFGSSLPKTGAMKAVGKYIYTGANSYFLYANDNDILKNKKIKFIAYDDKYEPELTYENTKKLIKDKIFLFFGFVGTPTVKSIMPLVENSDIPFIAPLTGASFLRNKNKKNIVNFRSSYEEEISTIINYLYNKKNIRKFAVFYQNDDYGESGYISTIKILKKYNLDILEAGNYKRNTLSIRHAFNEISDAKPEAIIMIGAYQANSLFIKLAHDNKNLKETIFSNISFGDANEVVKELNYNTKNILFSQVVPYYNNETIASIKEYKNIYNKYYPNENYSFMSLEAFLAAKTVVNAIKELPNNLTRSNFLEKIKNLPTNQLDGLHTKFKNMQLYNKIYLFKYQDNKFKKVTYED